MTKPNLNPYVEDLVTTVVDIISQKYPVDIIAMYGSRARGDFAPSSDLEFFALAEEEIDGKFSFMFRGISVDLGFQTWRSKDDVISREGYWWVPAGTLAACRIVYARSEEARNRFENMREEVLRKHHDPGETRLDQAMATYSNMVGALGQLSLAKYHNDVIEAHGQVVGFVIGYAIMIAQVNGAHLVNNWGKNLDDLEGEAFLHQPEGTRQLLESMLTETDIGVIIELSTEFVERCRMFLMEQGNDIVEDYELEMLDNVTGLEYLYKIEKAIASDHVAAMAYAIADSQPHYARDLLKMAGQWTQSSQLQVSHEYLARYRKDYPDMQALLLDGDMEKLQAAIDETRAKILPIIAEKIDLPEFDDPAEIGQYFRDK